MIKLKELEKKNKLLIEKFDKLTPEEQQMFILNLETAVYKNKSLNNK